MPEPKGAAPCTGPRRHTPTFPSAGRGAAPVETQTQLLAAFVMR